MRISVEDKIEKLQNRLQDQLPKAQMRFAVRITSRHAELVVYVKGPNERDQVSVLCNELMEELEKEQSDPEIWIMARLWVEPLMDSKAESELLEQRREDFRRRHGMKSASRASS